MDYKCALDTVVNEVIIDRNHYKTNSLDETIAIYQWSKDYKKPISPKLQASFQAEQEIRGALGERLDHIRGYWSQFGIMDKRMDTDRLLERIMRQISVQIVNDDPDDDSIDEDDIL
jgi:hypothetical protein